MTIHKQSLLLPPALKQGDLIGVAAPAGPFEPDRFQAGLACLESLGFKVRCPEQIFERDGFLAGSDRRRAETLNTLLADGEIKAVIGARGGYGAMRLFDRLAWESLRASPKIILGFSDLTALLLAANRAAGLVVFHGPVVTSLAGADQETVSHLERLLTGKPVFPLDLGQAGIISPGRAQGPLLGGNLTMLIHLLAASRLPSFDRAILVIEDIGEALYRLDRMLTTLKLSGLLDQCAGIVIGRFQDCGPAEEVQALLDRALADFPGPVVSGFPLGHGPRNLALPLGSRAVLDTSKGILDMTEPYLA